MRRRLLGFSRARWTRLLTLVALTRATRPMSKRDIAAALPGARGWELENALKTLQARGCANANGFARGKARRWSAKTLEHAR